MSEVPAGFSTPTKDDPRLAADDSTPRGGLMDHATMPARLRIACRVLILTVGLVGQSFAQNFPSRPVRIIGGAPGSILDIVARQLADKLSPALGQPVIAEDKGSGFMMMDAAAKSAPDGHTLVVANFSMLAVIPHMYE